MPEAPSRLKIKSGNPELTAVSGEPQTQALFPILMSLTSAFYYCLDSCGSGEGFEAVLPPPAFLPGNIHSSLANRTLDNDGSRTYNHKIQPLFEKSSSVTSYHCISCCRHLRILCEVSHMTALPYHSFPGAEGGTCTQWCGEDSHPAGLIGLTTDCHLVRPFALIWVFHSLLGSSLTETPSSHKTHPK